MQCIHIHRQTQTDIDTGTHTHDNRVRAHKDYLRVREWPLHLVSVSNLYGYFPDILFTPQESPRSSQPVDKKDVSLNSDADRPPTPGKLFSQGADSSLGSVDGSRSRERGASPQSAQKENENPKISASQVAPGWGPGGDHPAKDLKKEQAEDIVEAEEEGSRREEGAAKETPAPEENTSDASEVSPLVPRQLSTGTCCCSLQLLIASCLHVCITESGSQALNPAVNISQSP